MLQEVEVQEANEVQEDLKLDSILNSFQFLVGYIVVFTLSLSITPKIINYVWCSCDNVSHLRFSYLTVYKTI